MPSHATVRHRLALLTVCIGLASTPAAAKPPTKSKTKTTTPHHVDPPSPASPKKASGPKKKKAQSKAKKPAARSEPTRSIKPLSPAQKQEYLRQRGAALTFELHEPTVLTPRHPWHDPATFIRLVAHGGSHDDPSWRRAGKWALHERGIDRSLWAGQPDTLLYNYVALRFRAAANQAYLIDCSVSSGRYEERDRYEIFIPVDPCRSSCAPDVPMTEGTATYDPDTDHLLRFLPAEPRARTVDARVMGSLYMTFEGCEVTPLVPTC